MDDVSKKTLLIYDDQCSLCRNFKELVDKLDWKGQVQAVGFDHPEVSKRLPELDRAALRQSFHLIRPLGQHDKDENALAELLALLPLGRPLAWGMKTLPGGKALCRGILRRIASWKT